MRIVDKQEVVSNRSITAAELRESDLGEIVALPTVSCDTMVGGSLEAFTEVKSGVRISVRSRADGERSSYTLAANDEVVIYDGARKQQDAAGLPPVIADLLADSLTPAGIEQWFTTANRALRGKSPREAMRSGRYQQVMAAANAFAEGFYV